MLALNIIWWLALLTLLGSKRFASVAAWLLIGGAVSNVVAVAAGYEMSVFDWLISSVDTAAAVVAGRLLWYRRKLRLADEEAAALAARDAARLADLVAKPAPASLRMRNARIVSLDAKQLTAATSVVTITLASDDAVSVTYTDEGPYLLPMRPGDGEEYEHRVDTFVSNTSVDAFTHLVDEWKLTSTPVDATVEFEYDGKELQFRSSLLEVDGRQYHSGISGQDS